MPDRKLKLQVELDGEKQYKEHIAEINRENRTLGAQMEKLKAEYKGNEQSIEALTKKHELLDRQLLENQAKVAETKKQLDSWREAQARVREELGANSDEYKVTQQKIQEYEAALARAETAEIKTQNAIKDTNEALENNGKITITAGDAVNKLASKLGINLPEGATKGLNGVMKFSTETVAQMGLIAAAVAAAVKAYKALFDLTVEAASRADELNTNSLIYGVSTDQLQKWQYASEFIDVSVETMRGSLTKLTNTAYDAANGNEKLAETYAQLGVSVTDTATGSMRPAEDIFYDVVDALGRVYNQTERDAIAMDIMGKSAQELNPLIAAGSDELQRLGDEAEKTGYVLDEWQIKQLQDVDDAYQAWQLQIEATKNQLAVVFAPAAEAALKVVTKAVEVLTKEIEFLNKITEKASNAMRNLLGLNNEMKGYGGIGSDVAGATWHDDVQAWVSAGGTIIDSSNINSFDKSTGKLTNEWYYDPGWYTGDVVSYGRMSDEELRRLMGRNASGDANWRGGLTWVGESGPELVALPRGSQIYSNQESRGMGGGTDTSRIEALLARNVELLEEIGGEFSGLRVRRRMA